MWQNIIFVGLGSIVGGVSRYFISEWSRHLFPSSFPCGFFTSHPAPVYRLFFTVGFCGSFTTFSTFSFENLQLLSNKAYGLFSLNIGLSLILGILFAGLGYLMTNK